MTTDTVFQLIDRAAIARLKEFHYKNDGRDSEARLASDEAANLEAAGDELLADILSGVRDYPVHYHLRYHNHGDVEDRTEKSGVKTVFMIASSLAAVHAEYWKLQSNVNTIKKLLNSADECGSMATIHSLNEEFVSLQRKIDMCNQYRNEHIETGDMILKEMIDGAERVLDK